jgi:hypothetical protein
MVIPPVSWRSAIKIETARYTLIDADNAEYYENAEETK